MGIRKLEKRDIGHPRLKDDEPTGTMSFKAPKSLIQAIEKRWPKLKFASKSDYIRLTIEQEMQTITDKELVEQLNKFKNENIELRAELKQRGKEVFYGDTPEKIAEILEKLFKYIEEEKLISIKIITETES